MTAPLIGEAGLFPTALWARAVKRYVLPFVRPVTTCRVLASKVRTA
jgi:hypothetical protein